MNIIFKTKFGSHLYGTSTPSSDLDYKGIFIESTKNIVLGKDSRSIQENTKTGTGKNSKDDVDCEYIELRKFIRDALSGQTYAIDMLFSTEEHWEYASYTWKDIIKNREKFLSRNVKPYMSYCRKQAGKYGLKGSRLDSLKYIVEFLTSKNTFEKKLRLEDVLDGMVESEFVKLIKVPHTRNGETVEIDFLEVLGKRFSLRDFVTPIITTLNKTLDLYGDRAKLAQDNQGVDWKAMSHAFRASYQIIELSQSKHITFPLKEASYLTRIKNGELPFSTLQEELNFLVEEAEQLVEQSSLPDEPDHKFWEKFILDTYLPIF